MSKILLFNPKSAEGKYRIPNSILSIAASVEGRYEWVIVDGNRDPEPLETMESYLTRSAKAYLEGQNDWKWIITTMNQSGLNKRQARQLLLPLKNHGWKFRALALFTWLETN